MTLSTSKMWIRTWLTTILGILVSSSKGAADTKWLLDMGGADLGPWGPLVLAVVYIPLTVLTVPASVLTLGGGYLYGLLVGFVADSLGASFGATAAFLLGRTIGRSYVTAKIKDYPRFQAVAIAVQRSGFKIVLLLRLVPLLPFNMLNYLLSVTPVPLWEHILASWLGMMAFFSQLLTQPEVCIVFTVCDLLKIFLISSLVVSVILMICVTKVAKNALDKALAENVDAVAFPELPISVASPLTDLRQPLIVKIDPAQEKQDSHEN
ncbi:hypothetical protein Nepgr_021854 [Nepenthes gracilis]|uniref:VTT domain-containing protein n=1 Tax=Nepenthes gracilis TaxID=150966 RepID=A0AAD3SXJ4_NEPGR|nr:hypothetical protein Nepgr_021854 [Nepenthes gracilis]